MNQHEMMARILQDGVKLEALRNENEALKRQLLEAMTDLAKLSRRNVDVPLSHEDTKPDNSSAAVWERCANYWWKGAKAFEAIAERTQVQLAGCAVAAQGGSPKAKPGDYGWSPAYADVERLRANYDALLKANEAAK